NKLTFGGSIWKVRKKPPYGLIDTGEGKMLRKKELDAIKEEFEFKTKGWSGIMNQNASLGSLKKKTIDNVKDEFEFKTKGYIGLIDNQTMSQEGFGRVDSKVVENAKKDYEIKTKGYGGITLSGLGGPQGTFHKKDIEEIKANFRGIDPKQANYSGIGSTAARTHTLDTHYIEKAKERFKEVNANYGGLQPLRPMLIDKPMAEKAKQQFKSVAYKGTNPKTTRPFTNNDCGLLSPIDKEAIKRLRYVNLTAYDFRKVYKMFYEAFYVRKGLERECFIYADPPFPGTEKYYGDLFPPELHQDLIDLMLETPFNFML
ncbi:hypothetical protein LCGC14_3059870, partial [marine sediment metagenome]